MAAPTEGTSIPSDGTTDETIAREDEEDEERKEEGKESRASGEKKGSYRGGTGGSATGGQQHGDTVSVLQPGTWTWTWTWTLWNSRARRGTGREARHGRHSSGKMHKAVVSWLLYMTVLQQRPLPRNRGRLAGPRGRGLVATHEGPKRGRWRARGRGALVFPGFAAAAVVVASGELRLGGGARERVLWLSSCRRQSCNPQISKSLPLRLCLRCCSRGSRGCSRERGDGDGGGGALLLSCPRTTATRTGTRARDEVNWTATGSLTRAEWVVLDGLAVGRVEGGKRTTTTGKGRLNKHSNPSFPSPRVSRLPCAVPTLSQADKHIGQSVVTGQWTLDTPQRPDHRPDHTTLSPQPLRHYILRQQFVQCL